MREQEFVEYKITAKVPKKLNSLLEGLAKFVGVSVEEILVDELGGVLDVFVQNGFYEAWTEIALQKKGINC